jgi:hypothetical protein
MEEADGFLDVITLGNLIQMRHLVNREYYLGTMSWEEMKEDVTAQLAYLLLMGWFGKKYTVLINGQAVPIKGLVD